jgi:hypothetical protein
MKMRSNRPATPKSVTLKDVRYALEFGHERLIKTITHGKRDPAEYHLDPSGYQVSGKIAQQIINDADIEAIEDGLFPGNPQTYVWKERA